MCMKVDELRAVMLPSTYTRVYVLFVVRYMYVCPS